MPDRQEAKSKISDEFSSRLDHLKPRDTVRAILLLHTPVAAKFKGKTREHRIRAIQDAAEQALDGIDDILHRHKGQRLAEHANALGSVPVETTAAGIKALAASEHVKAILEDQPIALVQ